jgi:hypothetical protein
MFLAQAFVCVLHVNELFIIINESDNIELEVVMIYLRNIIFILTLSLGFFSDKVRRPCRPKWCSGWVY